MKACRLSIAGLLIAGMCAVGGSLNVPLHSQEPLTFDVATVRLNRTRARPIIEPQLQPGGRVIARSAPIEDVIRVAFGLNRRQEVTGPALLKEEVDIQAQVPEQYVGTATLRHQIPEMLRNLLTKRLKMKAQLVRRETAVYLLSLAHSDGQLGPRIKREAADCEAMRAATAAARAEFLRAVVENLSRSKTGLPALEVAAPPGPICGASGWTFHSAPIDLLVGQLEGILRGPVVDRTGLEGTYTFTLDFSVMETLVSSGLAPPVALQPDGKPSLKDALVQQLGFRLEPGRAPIESVHVEHIEAPDLN